MGCVFNPLTRFLLVYITHVTLALLFLFPLVYQTIMHVI